MKSLPRARPELSPSRAEKVFAIKEAIQAGTYEIDSAKVANELIFHLLNHSIRLHRASHKLH